MMIFFFFSQSELRAYPASPRLSDDQTPDVQARVMSVHGQFWDWGEPVLLGPHSPRHAVSCLRPSLMIVTKGHHR